MLQLFTLKKEWRLLPQHQLLGSNRWADWPLYLHIIYTVSTQYLTNIYTLSAQYLHTFYTLSTEYLHGNYIVSTPYLPKYRHERYPNIYTTSTHCIYTLSTEYLRYIIHNTLYVPAMYTTHSGNTIFT